MSHHKNNNVMEIDPIALLPTPLINMRMEIEFTIQIKYLTMELLNSISGVECFRTGSA